LSACGWWMYIISNTTPKVLITSVLHITFLTLKATIWFDKCMGP